MDNNKKSILKEQKLIIKMRTERDISTAKITRFVSTKLQHKGTTLAL